MHPGEKRVAETIAADLASAVERTAQDVADAAGVGRATVVRTAQTLGYDGYPQLRVAIAGEVALEASSGDMLADGTLLGGMRASFERFANRLGHTLSGVTEDALQTLVHALDTAPRVFVVANGLSSPLGLDLVLRLTAAGRSAEQLSDPLAQRIAARQLGASSVCLIVSGSGANAQTLSVAHAAKKSGATVIAVTSFARSAIAKQADAVLIVPPVNDSFQDELLHTSRAALMLVTEALVDALIARRGERGHEARTAVLEELADTLRE
nr:MurR/RpiR family transcriptional regulator [Microbacterium amylolyticum]